MIFLISLCVLIGVEVCNLHNATEQITKVAPVRIFNANKDFYYIEMYQFRGFVYALEGSYNLKDWTPNILSPIQGNNARRGAYLWKTAFPFHYFFRVQITPLEEFQQNQQQGQNNKKHFWVD